MRKVYLDYARAVGISVVVWAHVLERVPLEIQESVHYLTEFLLSAMCMPLLLLVSGALSAKYITKDDVRLIESLKKFARSILIPFYALNALFFLVNVVGSFFISGLPSAQEMIVALVTLKIGDSLPSGVLWFFLALFLFSVSVSIWHKVVPLNAYYLLAGAFAIRVFAYPLVSGIPYFAINRYAHYFVYYVMGFCLWRIVLKDDHRWYLAVPLMCAYFVLSSVSTGVAYADSALSVFSSFCGCFGAMQLLKYLSRWDNALLLSALRYVGVNSIVVFVFHMPCFKIIAPALSVLGVRDTFTGFLAWFALGVIFPLIIGEVLACLPRLYAALFARMPPQATLFNIVRLIRQT